MRARLARRGLCGLFCACVGVVCLAFCAEQMRLRSVTRQRQPGWCWCFPASALYHLAFLVLTSSSLLFCLALVAWPQGPNGRSTIPDRTPGVGPLDDIIVLSPSLRKGVSDTMSTECIATCERTSWGRITALEAGPRTPATSDAFSFSFTPHATNCSDHGLVFLPVSFFTFIPPLVLPFFFFGSDSSHYLCLSTTPFILCLC